MLLDGNSMQGKDELNDLPPFDSVVYIFWSANFPPALFIFFGLGVDLFSSFGGVAASLAFVLSWRLATEIRHR